jgi:hypothetical protein
MAGNIGRDGKERFCSGDIRFCSKKSGNGLGIRRMLSFNVSSHRFHILRRAPLSRGVASLARDRAERIYFIARGFSFNTPKTRPARGCTAQ